MFCWSVLARHRWREEWLPAAADLVAHAAMKRYRAVPPVRRTPVASTPRRSHDTSLITCHGLSAAQRLKKRRIIAPPSAAAPKISTIESRSNVRRQQA